MKFLKPDENRFPWRFSYFSRHFETFALVLFLITQTTLLQGQDVFTRMPVFPKFNIGFGSGMDYGGFGVQVAMVTSERVELFGAIGYNRENFGYNVGVDYRMILESTTFPICPYYGIMYGYNAVIRSDGLDHKNDGLACYGKTYYGFSFKLGLEFWTKKSPCFLNVELIVPVRSDEYHESLKTLKKRYDIDSGNGAFPVGLSIGCHFVL